jgi:hypothetical protein
MIGTVLELSRPHSLITPAGLYTRIKTFLDAITQVLWTLITLIAHGSSGWTAEQNFLILEIRKHEINPIKFPILSLMFSFQESYCQHPWRDCVRTSRCENTPLYADVKKMKNDARKPVIMSHTQPSVVIDVGRLASHLLLPLNSAKVVYCSSLSQSFHISLQREASSSKYCMIHLYFHTTTDSHDAGTYLLMDQLVISNSGVVLRGAGAGVSTLFFNTR